MAFQERNGTCGMKPERSGRNLAEKSGTDRDLKWDENCFVFWIGMECFGHSGRNGTELTTLIKMIKIKTQKYKPSLPKKKLVTWHFLPLPLPLKNKLNMTLYFTLRNSPTLLVLHSRNVHFFFSTLIAHHQATSTSSSSSTITQHLFATRTSFSMFTTTINPTLV
jgi:hypothetical protein